MIRMHTGYIPKYTSGKWYWDESADRLKYKFQDDLEHINDTVMDINGFKFKKTLNEEDELIFIQQFQRPSTTFDADVILIDDIRRLAIFMMPADFLTPSFLEFVHTKEVYNLIHSLIIYFEYYLKFVEFILVRNDEIITQMQSVESVKMKRNMSDYLAQFRLLVAREYSRILLGEEGMAKFYHTSPIVNVAKTLHDKVFHEQFLAVLKYIVWIAMHRRAYEEISREIGRLFRSDYFTHTKQSLHFNEADRRLLVGRKYRCVNYRYQNSPLIQELISMAHYDLPILWIGVRKYRGTNFRIHELELEYITPDSQLSVIDIAHGILGHPKICYNTALQIDWGAVRFQKFNADDDPYRLIRQPYIKLPHIHEDIVHRHAKHFVQYLQLYRHHEIPSKKEIGKWLRRETICDFYKTKGTLRNIWTRCQENISDPTFGMKYTVLQVVARFLGIKSKLQKKTHHKQATW